MAYAWEAEARNDRPRTQPYVTWDPPAPAEPCANPACARAIAAERRIQHALSELDARQRAEVNALERRVWELGEEIARLTREKGDAA